MNLEEAYDQCEVITRREAKNFAYGIRLLDRPRRRAMSAVYAYARRIDDIGDGHDDPDVKLTRLDQVDHEIAALAERQLPDEEDPVLVALSDVVAGYAVPITAFSQLTRGCRQDSTGFVYETFDDLVDYCRLVAGSIGRLSLGVFGTDDWDRASAYADDLGVALQLTNILRDVKEDREELGRVYLPAEDLRRFGCHLDATGPRDAMGRLVAFEAERAEQWYEAGVRLLPMLDTRSRACVSAMAGIYRRLLTRIQADPAAVLTTRVSLPTSEKLRVAARSLAGRGW